MDTESEKIVQEALDVIMADKNLITIVIAHRLSTIRGADKIIYVDHGKVREVGTYAELMAKPHGHYKRLENLQALDQMVDRKSLLSNKKAYEAADKKQMKKDAKKAAKNASKDAERRAEQEMIDKEKAKINEKKAKQLAREEYPLFIIGSIGALLNGIM